MHYMRNKIVFLVLAAMAGFVGLISAGLTPAGIGIFAACFGAVYLIVVRNPFGADNPHTPRIPASAYLPVYMFGVLLASLGARWKAIADAVSGENLTPYAESFSRNAGFALVMLVAVLMLPMGLSKDGKPWLFGISITLFGMAMVAVRWVDVDSATWFIPWGRAIFFMYALAAFTIGVAHILAEMTIVGENAKLRRLNRWVTVFSVLLITGINILGCGPKPEGEGEGHPFGYVGEVSQEAFDALVTLPDTWMAWWKVIVACVILFVLMLVLMPDNLELPVGPDALVVSMVGINVLATRFLFSNWFTHAWAVMILLTLFEMVLIATAHGRPAQEPGNAVQVMTVVAIAAIASVIALHKGLWPNVVVTLVLWIGFILRRNSAQPKYLYAGSAIAILLEAAAWQGARRFSTEGLFLLAIIAAIAVLAFVLIYWPHPAGASTQNNARTIPSLVVLGCVAAIGLAALPTTQKVDAKVEDTTVNVVAKAKGKGNAIESVHYSWRNLLGKETAGGDCDPASISLPIRDQALVLTITDKRGFTSTRIWFYPDWKYGRAPAEEAQVPAEGASEEPAPEPAPEG